MNCVVGAFEPDIAADVRGHRNLSGRCCGGDDFAFSFKGPNDLNTKVNVHRGFTSGGMMIEETIMPIDAQAVVPSEKFPNQIESWFPGLSNVCDAHAPPHGRE